MVLWYYKVTPCEANTPAVLFHTFGSQHSIQLSAYSLETEKDSSSVLGSGTHMSPRPLTLAWPSPGHCHHLGSESENDKPLSNSLFLSIIQIL